MKVFTFSVFVLMLLSLESCSYSELNQERIKEAAQSYETGQFEASVDKYTQLISDGIVNGAIYYNLASSFYRVGKKGQALSCLLRARDLLPRDPDVKANLNFLLSQIDDKLSADLKPSWFQRLNVLPNLFSNYELLWVLSFAFAAVFILMGCYFLKKSEFFAKSLAYLAAFIFVLAVWLACSLVSNIWTDKHWFALTGEKINVYSAPNKLSGSVLFELHEGAPVEVQYYSGPSAKIVISDGKSGWIEKTNLALCSKID